MPTGYTAAVNDGTMTSLREYALTCVRAFGVAVELRDEPLSTPIPEHFDPDTRYHDERIAEVRKRLDELVAMTAEQRQAACNEANKANAAARVEQEARAKAIRERYDAMTAKVAAWETPHTELRKFMLEQLDQSKDFDCQVFPLEAREPYTPETWYEAEFEEAARSLGYHEKERAKVIARTAQRNAWLEELRQSLIGVD